MNDYADWTMQQVREHGVWLRGVETGLERAIRLLPAALANTKVHEDLKGVTAQRVLLHERYEAILAERRERRKTLPLLER